jgi:hypothetical protein
MSCGGTTCAMLCSGTSLKLSVMNPDPTLLDGSLRAEYRERSPGSELSRFCFAAMTIPCGSSVPGLDIT